MLEKILQEIEALCLGKYYVEAEKVKEIIRSHMEDDGWIPGNEIPREDDCYIVAWLPKVMTSRARTPHYYGIWDYEDNKWCVDVPETYKRLEITLLAWRPLPAPYRPKEEN